jgi:MSHA pilin protein MshC
MKLKEIMKKRWKNNSGFTLIEVIAVLIILAIVSAVAISRGMDTQAVKLQTEVDTLKGHLRYAQYLGMNDIAPTKWGIQISGQSYTLVRNANGDGATFNSPYNLPGDSSATHNMAPFAATVVNVLFDEWGSPGTANINVALGGQTIEIKAETGFIP